MHLNRLLIGVVLFALASPLCAATIEAEGVAVITEAGVERARQMAIQDAKNQISMQSGVKVETSVRVRQNDIPLKSSRVQPITKNIGDVTVVREWQGEGSLHVLISANTEHSIDSANGSSRYKKKIIATPFHIRTPYQANDIDEISTGFPRELLLRLENSNKFLTKISSYVSSDGANGPSQDDNAIKRIATLYNSQFVISGELLNAGNLDKGGYLSFLQTNKRPFEIEIYIHDGLTGALISRHRIGKFAEGEVIVGRDKPFASAQFLSTNYGRIVNEVIDAGVELISKDLEKLPFAAKVIQVAGDKIFLDAGSTSFIAPGDQMVAYHVKRALPLGGLGPNGDYGVVETPVTTVTVVQVQPLFSICKVSLEATNSMIEVGDIVRFESASQN